MYAPAGQLRTHSGFELDIGADPALVRRLAAGDAASAFVLASRRLGAAGVRCTVRAGTATPDTGPLVGRGLGFHRLRSEPPDGFSTASTRARSDHDRRSDTPQRNATRLLFRIPVKPLQGRRFQPTGFPSLGAGTFQTGKGTSLLVESAQSMANRLEMTVWDAATNDVKDEFKGLSHVHVARGGEFLTDTILESHRFNSPAIC